MSQDRFSLILRAQLKVSRQEFWQAIKRRRPVRRPVPEAEPPPPAHRPYISRVLKRDLHMSEEQIAELSPSQAEKLVHDHWSRQGQGD